MYPPADQVQRQLAVCEDACIFSRQQFSGRVMDGRQLSPIDCVGAACAVGLNQEGTPAQYTAAPTRELLHAGLVQATQRRWAQAA